MFKDTGNGLTLDEFLANLDKDMKEMTKKYMPFALPELPKLSNAEIKKMNEDFWRMKKKNTDHIIRKYGKFS